MATRKNQNGAAIGITESFVECNLRYSVAILLPTITPPHTMPIITDQEISVFQVIFFRTPKK